jgi:hypothetical protein
LLTRQTLDESHNYMNSKAKGVLRQNFFTQRRSFRCPLPCYAF